MSNQYRFTVGQIVNMLSRQFESPVPAGPFRIVMQLPEADGEKQYRIKSTSEPFERMVGEGRLTPR